MNAPASGCRRARSVVWSGVVVLILAGPVLAQPPREAAILTSLAVPGTPEGILNAADFTAWGGDRASLFLDVVRHLYAAPVANSPAVRGMRRHARTVTDFMEAWRAVRATDGDVRLALAADRGARRRLEDLVEAAGFRLRRASRAYEVRIDDGGDARARRASLRDAGLAIDLLDQRLNAGEPLAFELPTFDVPLPLTAEVWRNTVAALAPRRGRAAGTPHSRGSARRLALSRPAVDAGRHPAVSGREPAVAPRSVRGPRREVGALRAQSGRRGRPRGGAPAARMRSRCGDP